ncbi:MAG: hypothetical protein QOE70_5593 [Chthoniobacter sp.]|jgi:hypothetical protein|nr:hypothetical protein [Chthoniobacter sp.]
MKKPLSILAIIGVIAAVSLTAYAAYLKQSPTFEIYGEDLIAVNAPDYMIAGAENDVHRLFVDWKKDAEGKPHDPSFMSASHSWDTGKTNQTKTTALSRCTTEFNDAQGHHIVIERIAGKNMPTLVFFSPKSGDGTMPVLDAFVSSLQKQGVRLATH